MSVSPQMMIQVAEWRQKAREGTLTQDEMREAIKFLRAERMAMPEKATSKSKTAKPIANADDLLGELDLL